MQSQSQMQVAIRSMRAVRFGDSKKLVLHTWPARPPTRSYQGPRLGRPLVLPETEAETHSGSTLAVSHGHASDCRVPCAGASFSYCGSVSFLS